MKKPTLFLVVFTIIVVSYFTEKEKISYNKKISDNHKNKIYRYTLENKLSPTQKPQFFSVIGKAFSKINDSGSFLEFNLFNDTQEVIQFKKITIIFNKQCSKESQNIIIQRNLPSSKNTFITNIKTSCPFINKIVYRFNSSFSENLINIEFAKMPLIDTRIIKISNLTITADKPFKIDPFSTYIINHLNIEKDVFLKFSKYSSFIVKNSIKINGESNMPVIISGEKESGGIFTDKAHIAVLKNVKIVGFSGGVYNNTYYPGALSFIRSQKIIMEDIVMLNNFSEDTLHMHTVESFSVNNLSISFSLDDAFDTNNSIGTLSNSKFFNCGGDCVDFYHSNVNLKNIYTDTAIDKGISIGELSHVHASHIETKSSPIGIGVKDGSVLQINDSKLRAKQPLFKLGNSIITQNKNNVKLSSTELINE